MHVKVVHKYFKPPKCDYCEKRFVTSTSLKNHHKTVHENVKKYVCDCYDNSFAYKGNLETHFKTAHDGMKPYKCDYCEKTLGTLEIHTCTPNQVEMRFL